MSAAEHLPPEVAEAMADAMTDRPAEPVLVRVCDVAPERVEWLWPGRLPLGKVTVLDGDPGLGKSTVTLDLAARVSIGGTMPDGHQLDGPRGVVLLSAEDGIADTIRPRLDAAGADTSRVVVLDAVIGDDGLRPPSLPGDMPALTTAIERTGAALVIVDPLMAFLHGGVNSYRDQDVRRALHPLKTLAETTGAAIVLVRHLNKGGGGTAVYRGGGSIGIIGAARLGLLIAADPDDPLRRILAVAKSNLAAVPSSLAYRLVTDDPLTVARVEWQGGSTHTADSLLAVPATDEERTAQDEAVGFLREALAEGGRPATDVKREAKAAGIAERTLERARSRAGVTTKRDGFGKGATYLWSLPDVLLETPDDGHGRHDDGHVRHARHYPEDGKHGEHADGDGDHDGSPLSLDVLLAAFPDAVLASDDTRPAA